MRVVIRWGQLKKKVVIGGWLAAALLAAACGKSSHNGHEEMDAAGAAGELAEAGGGQAHPAGGEGLGGFATGGGTNGEGGATAGEGPAGAGGEAVDERFQLIEPVAPLSSISYEGKTVTLEPSDVLAPSASVTHVSDDASVIVGTWRYTMFRPKTSAVFPWGARAFRWTREQGAVALVEGDDVGSSSPIGMNQGDLVFVHYLTFDGMPHVCRWNPQTGCEKLPELSDATSITDLCQRQPGYGSCVSRDGAFLVVNSPTMQQAMRAARWSQAHGWETAVDQLALGIDDEGNVLLNSGTSFSWWPLGGAPVLLALPNGTDRCHPHFSEAGTLIVGDCRMGNDAASEQVVRWSKPETPVAWDGPSRVDDISPEGDVVLGQGLPLVGDVKHRVALRWTEAGGKVMVFEPAEADVSVQQLYMSRYGDVVWGTASAGPGPEQWFRWSPYDGATPLPIPQGSDGPRLSSDDGSVLAGGITFWDSQGTRTVTDVLDTIGVERRGFTPESIQFVGADDPLWIIGTGKPAPDQDAFGPLKDDVSGIYIARLPKR